MSHHDMDRRTATGTLALTVCLGGGALALAGAVGWLTVLALLLALLLFALAVLALCVWLSE